MAEIKQTDEQRENMKDRNNRITLRRDRRKGFTTVELVVVVAVMLIVAAMALPNFMQAYHNYQLNDGASKVADILKRTRFDAIRGDAAVNCQILAGFPGAGQIAIWSDVNARGPAGPARTDTQVNLTGSVRLVAAAGVPGRVALAGRVGAGAAAQLALNPISPANGLVTFDQRGAVAAPVGVNVMYLSYNGLPNLGYRAVVVLPNGSVQMWQGDAVGNWHFFD